MRNVGILDVAGKDIDLEGFADGVTDDHSGASQDEGKRQKFGQMTDDNGATAPRIAAWKGQAEVVEKLTGMIQDEREHQEPLQTKGELGRTALHGAIWEGRFNAIEKVDDKRLGAILNPDQRQKLDSAELANQSAVQELNDSPSTSHDLRYAARKGRAEFVGKLLGATPATDKRQEIMPM